MVPRTQKKVAVVWNPFAASTTWSKVMGWEWRYLVSGHHGENDQYRLYYVLRIYPANTRSRVLLEENLVTMPGVLGLSVPTSVEIAVQD